MDANLIEKIQEPIFGLLGLGLSFMALFIIYRAIQFKNHEKLALIEKGMDPRLAESKPSQSANLKNGLILIGVAVGVLCGYILNMALGIPNFVSYSSMIFIFCGTLLVFYYKSKKE